MRAEYVQAHPLGITMIVAKRLEKHALEKAYEKLISQKKLQLGEWKRERERERAKERGRKLAGVQGEQCKCEDSDSI